MTKSRFYLHNIILLALMLVLYCGLAYLAKNVWHIKETLSPAMPVVLSAMLAATSQNKLLKKRLRLRKWYIAGICSCIAGTAAQIILQSL